MSVSPINAIRASTPLQKAAKTVKVSKRDVTATGADPDEKPRKPAKQPAKDAKREVQASTSAASMSSSAVQAALTFLKSGG